VQWQHCKRIACSSFSTYRKNQPYGEPEPVCSRTGDGVIATTINLKIRVWDSPDRFA